MTKPADDLVLERPPEVRRRNAEATRAAILAAGKRHFAESGYEGAYLRDIAAEAGVDAALINRYFGGKEGLFQACLRAAIHSAQFFEGERAGFGARVARVFAERSPENFQAMLGFKLVLRAATSPSTAHMLSETAQERFMGPIRDWLGGPDAMARARLFSSLFIGLLVEGLIREETLAEPERSAYADRLGALFQQLVDG
ncbi:MAG TPA: TetR family transcriptional regulator [Caulobacteraceae bacterium]|nr:TetR family transcriptional regulator [Caulobacteraceae bacterium]